MALVSLVLLILLGLLGIASWLKSRQPKLGRQMGGLESIEGWVGLVGLIYGLFMLLQYLLALRGFAYAPGPMLIALFSILVIIALSLILTMPLLRQLIGANGFTNGLAAAAARMAPFKVVLGFICLVFALIGLLALLGVRTF